VSQFRKRTWVAHNGEWTYIVEKGAAIACGAGFQFRAADHPRRVGQAAITLVSTVKGKMDEPTVRTWRLGHMLKVES
jgi:hypothetical protein